MLPGTEGNGAAIFVNTSSLEHAWKQKNKYN